MGGRAGAYKGAVLGAEWWMIGRLDTNKKPIAMKYKGYERWKIEKNKEDEDVYWNWTVEMKDNGIFIPWMECR